MHAQQSKEIEKMSDKDSDIIIPGRRAAKSPIGIINPADNFVERKTKPVRGSNGPAIIKGIKPQTTEDLLAGATDEQIKAIAHMNFATWSQYGGFEVDGREKFGFERYRYLLPIYLDDHPKIVWMKAAQLGATIYLLLKLLWLTVCRPLKAGLYFPTADGVNKLVKDRLNPLIDSNPMLRDRVNIENERLDLKQIHNIHGGLSALYLLYLGGTSSKDSHPLDVLAFDEVRLSDAKAVDQARERISGSDIKIEIFTSTAGLPGEDIDRRFRRGTMHTWRTKCNCRDGVNLAEVFPECMAITEKEIYYRCPTCKVRIRDAQNGAFVPINPKADVHSYAVSKLVSKKQTPAETWDKFQTTTNMREFWNANLGLPYIDQDSVPVTDSVLEACVNYELPWATNDWARTDLRRRCAMGVDQHSGNNYAVITRRNANGKKQIVHIELMETANPRYFIDGKPVSPFRRLYELMQEYDVGICVIDAMPNANEAMDFARYFPGRVFLSWYMEGGSDVVRWLDRPKEKQQVKKNPKELKLKWQVYLNRYLSIDDALADFVERSVEMPHPDRLVQVARSETGRFEAINLCRDVLWPHLKGLARERKDIDPEIGTFKMVWRYLGIDPHFMHAYNYSRVALGRLSRQAFFVTLG